MMFPNSPSPTPPMAAIVPDAAFETGTDGLAHADYDLQPMAVPSLDHYVIRVEEGERFHVH
jgi:hypothetical protein